MLRRRSIYTRKCCTDRIKEIKTKLSEELKRGIEGSDDKEFIVTNGIGGYSSLTLLNSQRRKFHGLLVASMSPPLNRWVIVANMEERLDEINLSSCKKIFKYDLLPEQVYEVNGIKLRRRIFMPYAENTTVLLYDASDRITFSFSPILAFRHFYETLDKKLDFKMVEKDGEVVYSCRNLNLRIIAPFSSFSREVGWIKKTYDIDRMRGESYEDLLFVGGKFCISKKNFHIIFTLEEKNYEPYKELETELARRKEILKKAKLKLLPDLLVLTADSFVVKRENSKSIIAGYHWFGEWGRDAMISLPGLLLVTNRLDEAREVILNFLRYMQRGLIPNSFHDRDGTIVYNSVDAPLWLIDRIFQYLKYTWDTSFVERTWPSIESIFLNFTKGTLFGIKMDEDCLLRHGKNLTWMDTRATPREGKAVEVQALWYNALMIMNTLSNLLGKKNDFRKIADRAKASFMEKYDRVYDVIGRDLSFRPNVLLAISLDFPLIEGNLAKEILERVEDELATPFGLRTLSRKDPNYKGRLIGEHDKDEAYHNGVAWPWLIGQFVRGYLRVNGYSEINRKYLLERYLENILLSLTDGCIGSINEVFDGEEPFSPGGCVSQAWSVAELLRAIVEDILFKRPPYEKRLQNYL
ncbi:MAG: glycogen debranching enzyme family protein [Thermoplasmata archaeon]|nr:glycogen debranching enzyme family protein [Thermoplasmata archaeon]